MDVRYSLSAGGRPAQTSLRIIELRLRGVMASFGSKRIPLFGECFLATSNFPRPSDFIDESAARPSAFGKTYLKTFNFPDGGVTALFVPEWSTAGDRLTL
jgi:hypothetical protein